MKRVTIHKLKYKIMRHSLSLTMLVFTCIFSSCTAKEQQRLSNIKGLQKAIVRVAAAAPNFSQDTESLRAFETADSIARSMTLQPDKEASDLASAYEALSYVAYGLNYGIYPMMWLYEVEPLLYIDRATDCIVKGNGEIGTFCEDLHVMELKSDQGFALFLEDPYACDSLAVWAMDNLKSEYKEGGNAFQSFQLQNRTFFFAYSQAIVHLTNEDDAEKVFNKINDIANELDSMPEETSSDEEYYEVFNKIIGARVQMINLMAMDLEHNKREWPK